MCYNTVKMTGVNNRHETAEKEKGNWFKTNRARLIAFTIVLAITVALFIYRDKVTELGNLGYLGAFLICLVSNATIILPMPGMLLLFALGATFNPFFIGLAGGVGGAIGEMSCYLLGYSGRGIVENRRLYDIAVRWLDRWGILTVFVFALTPLPFDVLGIAAGILRFPFLKFFIACLFGKTILYIGMAVAGYWGWEAFISGGYLTSPVSIAVYVGFGALLILVLALYIEKWTWKRRP